MPIELPDDLVIAARRVEVRNGRPEQPRRATAMDRVEVPVWRWTIDRIEAQRAVAQQVVFSSDDAVGARGAVAHG